jgi:4-amino-4-deoxychorismate lyase
LTGTRLLINGSTDATVSPLDRGLMYGDGLFESIRFVGERAPLWVRHMQRLEDGCQRLHMPVPETALLWQEACEVTRGQPQSMVRITLTRGVGERGYAPPKIPSLTRIVAAFAAPKLDEDGYVHGIHMRVCRLRLARQPVLAGIKHLNRLEQVLARAEWNDPAIAEGLLCDTAGLAISATMANLFAVISGMLCTPALDHCGIAGVARAEVLAVSPQADVCDIALDALLAAEEIFLTSSVRGILPVQSLDGRRYAPGKITRDLQRHWHNLGFSMEQAG